jgi:preprotein translocase subunit SecY
MAASSPQLFPALTGMWRQNESAGTERGLSRPVVFMFAWGVAGRAVVFMTKAQRRIPIQQAKQTRGRKVYGGQRHSCRYKVNHSA